MRVPSSHLTVATSQIPPRRNVGLGRGSVVKVELSGLKTAHARGKYYVYLWATGETLLRGFDGDKGALRRRLSMPDMLAAYNRPRGVRRRSLSRRSAASLTGSQTATSTARRRNVKQRIALATTPRAIRSGGPSWRRRRGRTTSKPSSGCGMNSTSCQPTSLSPTCTTCATNAPIRSGRASRTR
jgi:hypothetical protein